MALPRSFLAKSWTSTSSGCPWGCHSRPTLRNCPTSSFFLASTDTTGCRCLWNALTRRLRCWNWASRSGLALALDRLPVGLEAVPEGVEEAVDRPLAGGMPQGLEFGGQLGRTLARPPQRRHRVATGHGVDQSLQLTEEVGVLIDQGLSSTTGPA